MSFLKAEWRKLVLINYATSPEILAPFGANPNAPVFLSVANLKPQKDPLTLLEAFRQVVQSEPEASLLFVGDGPLRPRIRVCSHPRCPLLFVDTSRPGRRRWYRKQPARSSDPGSHAVCGCQKDRP